ncbi:MAG TPA: hypothetical protein VE969_00270 [Pyrinomonadaceae bacterium]|nr:hypothetical protein [Pyrinomonadaceae bacterium]
MARTIISVIAGYFAMFVLAFAGFTCAYLIVGQDVAFKPGLYEAASSWVAIAFIINIAVSVIGGFICATIAKSGRAPLALAIVVVVLGIVIAIGDTSKRKAHAGSIRTAAPQMEAIQQAYWPIWVPFTFPLTGAIGVLIGARLKKR